MLAPNKQNLLLVKKQKKVIKNGLKLLREKRTSLVMMFLEQARRGKQLEQKLSCDLQKVLDKYKQVTTFINIQKLISNLPIEPIMKLDVQKKRTSGVYLNYLKLELQLPSRPYVKRNIRESLNYFGRFFPLILEITQIKINCVRIAKEIEKTNRQISNLENHVENLTIEEKFITTSLNEKANLEKATLIKIFG